MKHTHKLDDDNDSCIQEANSQQREREIEHYDSISDGINGQRRQ